LNPFTPFTTRRQHRTDAAELYGAIVAQARLPVFYQRLGVPDTLEGRFLVLSLHLFAVLQRLKAEEQHREGQHLEGQSPEGQSARPLAQALTDRFSADMETVLREIGVGDLSIPKRMRRLAATSASLLDALEHAAAAGEKDVAAVLAGALPRNESLSEAASAGLAHYLREATRALDAQSVASLGRGEIEFPGVGEA
jgi:cytochrome b pre-mRNA-processing protein 3